jgi:hypothetical protein
MSQKPSPIFASADQVDVALRGVEGSSDVALTIRGRTAWAQVWHEYGLTVRAFVGYRSCSHATSSGSVVRSAAGLTSSSRFVIVRELVVR